VSVPAASPEALPLRGARRVLRSAVLGSASLALAVGAHVAGGGAAPGSGMLLLSAALVGLVALPATARRVRLGWLAPLLGLEQALLHALFQAAGSAVCTAPAATGAGHPGHHADAALACLPAAGSATMTMPDGPMLLAHLLATLATAWVLVRGESALWSLAERVVRAAVARPGVLRAAVAVPVPPAPRRRPHQRAHGAAAPRGPPHLLVVH
jgi:hypothetical protein